ncbi:filamentous hemagglutinin N-terminal domain-containing protein [Robbsia sp. KACC 23696]|uniref:two-partner secretion domain-containing protein n=1 Tax=Robbsia sp. KACC 23696 TaxID=3149231 RepID=UPI00325A5EFA
MALCSLIATVFIDSAYAAGIIVDGSTATTVSTASNGRQTVSIAPATYGVSRNNYTSFNVGTAGVALNNNGINARTIVNQVTSTNPSLIAGDVTVLGPRANVVLANPNGITVNGGSFVNTGRVALTTGQVSFNDVTGTDGSVIQRNIVLDTQSGTIVVGPQGLASALIGVDLIAKQIQVNGPLANTFTSNTASARIIGGTSSVTLDTSLSPTDNANDWLSLNTTTPSATRNASNGFAIDITAAGSLSSGRIELIVTDKGPGVRSAGVMNATYGDFTISSTGTVEMQGATMTAAAGIGVTGADVMLSNGSHGQTVIASNSSGVVIQSSGDISNTGALVQGSIANSSDSNSAGAVTMIASGNIVNRSQANSTLGILFGVAGDVALTAGGNITNENARILSNTGVSLAAGGDVDNTTDHSTGIDNGTPVNYASSGGFWFLQNKKNGVDIDYGQLADASQLAYITAASGNVVVSANNINNNGGSILADAGGISLTAAQTLNTQAVMTGQAAFHQSCFIFCHSSSSSTVQAYGGVIEASNDIALKAGQQIVNTGGMVLAYGRLSLDAPRTIAQAMTGYSAFNRTNDLKAWFGNAWSSIYAADTGGVFTGGSGQVTLTGVAQIEGGSYSAPGGVVAAGGINTVRLPYRQPMTIGNHNHVGLVSWFGL